MDKHKRRRIVEATLDAHPELELEVVALGRELGLRKMDTAGVMAALEAARLTRPDLSARLDVIVNKLMALSYLTEADQTKRYGKWVPAYGFVTKGESYSEMIRWLREPLVLQKPESTCYHKFVEECDLPSPHDPYLFLVQHDWAAAMANATEINQGIEFMAPAPKCCFEFKISGRRVIALAIADENGSINISDNWQGNGGVLVFVNTSHGWCPANAKDERFMDGGPGWERIPEVDGEELVSRLEDLVCKQIRVICVCLEAQAIATEAVHAPYKMNRARERKGKLPIYSYHIVSLLHRRRYERLPDDLRDGEKGTKRRLHFVRGHWRHYPNHKTRIKWHLRGDPDLGFIDKEYRL